MVTLDKKHLIEKKNVLNELRTNNMGLQELRLFSIYLSKINAREESTRVVRFTLDDFRAIMELGRLNIAYLKQVANSLLSKIVNVPTAHGGFTAFQLFKECTVDCDDSGEWYVTIDAHDKALPLMFDFKKDYFTYELWNALRLKSSNQLRMYEILKQFEKSGSGILSVPELKGLLGISDSEYPLYYEFRRDVLDVCQKALTENTDIKFTYEPYGKRGKGGKILFIKFIIEKNEDYTDPLSLSEFIKLNKDTGNDDVIEIDDDDLSPYDKKIKFFSDACDNEFSFLEIQVLYDLMVEHLPSTTVRDERKCYDYLFRKYRYMNMQNEKDKIKHRFRYMKSIIEKD